MKYCPNCGSELNKNTNICDSCNKSIKKEPSNKVGYFISIIAILLHIISIVFFFIFNKILLIPGFSSELFHLITATVSGSYLLSWILMIVGRVKYPKNILCKITMWLFIISLIALIIGLIIFISYCFNSIRGCGQYMG